MFIVKVDISFFALHIKLLLYEASQGKRMYKFFVLNL